MTLEAKYKMSRAKGGESYPGVTFSTKRNGWVSQSHDSNGERLYLGVYETETEAVQVLIKYNEFGELPIFKGRIKIQKNNTSGYEGISFHQPSGKWSARVMIDKKRKNLGYYDTPELAYKARISYIEQRNIELESLSSPSELRDSHSQPVLRRVSTVMSLTGELRPLARRNGQFSFLRPILV
jgi:hypothetical protein